MNERRDPERLIHAFLTEGQTELADQVYDTVRASIEQTSQRVVIGPWRMPIMNKLAAIGLGAAAVVVALVVGTQLLGPPASPGVGAAPSAEPSPTAEPSVAEPSVAAGGLEEGPHVLADGVGAGTPITLTIPGPGWYGERAEGILTRNDKADPPDGLGMVVFEEDLYVYGDPCQWSTTESDNPATTVDELVAALTAQASRDASAPVDVTVGGFAGKSITLHVPDDARFGDCDQGTFGSWRGTGDPTTPSRYHQGPGQIDELWIVDVDGVLTVIDAAYYAGTPAEHVAEMRAMVDSITFELP